MTLQQLIYFMEIARSSSYTVAATNLYVSQSSVSYAIRELELELSVPLFVRSGGKKVVLTEYGEAFKPYVEKALSLLQEGQDQLLHLRTLPAKRTVRILYSHFTAFYIVQQLFKKQNLFADQNISVQLDTNQSGENASIDALMNETADLVLSCLPPYQNLDGQKIAQQELVLICPTDHVLAHKKRVHISDIAEFPFLWYTGGNHFAKSVTLMFEHDGCKPNIVDKIAIYSNWFGHISHVALGKGITIVPNSVACNNGKIGFPNYVTIPIDNPCNTRNVNLLWKKDRVLPEEVLLVKEFCLEYSRTHELSDTFLPL